MVGIFYFELIRTVSLSRLSLSILYSYGVPTLYTKAYTNRYQISRASLSLAVERAAPSFSLVYTRTSFKVCWATIDIYLCPFARG